MDSNRTADQSSSSSSLIFGKPVNSEKKPVKLNESNSSFHSTQNPHSNHSNQAELNELAELEKQRKLQKATRNEKRLADSKETEMFDFLFDTLGFLQNVKN